MFCKNCGHKISDDAKFCSNCGTKVEVDKDVVVPVAVVDKTEEVAENNVEETLNTTNVEQSDVEVESVNENESTTPVKEWYYVSNNDSKGSFSIDEMKAKITSGEINGSTLVWKASMKDWERLENTELNEFISTSSSKDWYYVENNDSKGPFSESEMKSFISSGILTGNSFVWKTGMQDWQRLKNTELAGNETMHVEPSFSFTTGVVKEKSIGLCVVLSLVTCGIYSIYWLYTIAHDLNDLCESQNQENLRVLQGRQVRRRRRRRRIVAPLEHINQHRPMDGLARGKKPRGRLKQRRDRPRDRIRAGAPYSPT